MPMPTTVNQIGVHADALDARGWAVPERLVSDWDVYADFNGPDALVKAVDWAERVLATDERVASVSIRESYQEHEGGYWKAGRGLQRIHRTEPVAPKAAPQPVAPATEGGVRCGNHRGERVYHADGRAVRACFGR